MIPDRQNENRRRAPAAARPSSTRSAGAGGSSNTMLKLYTDSGEAGLKVCVFYKIPLGSSDYFSVANSTQCCSDPFVVIVLSISFIASIFFLHITAKIIRAFTN